METSAGPVARGEKISSALITTTNPPVAATNVSALASNSVPPPGVVAVTNTRPHLVMVGGEKYWALSFQQLSSFRFKVTQEMSAPDANPLIATASVLEQVPEEVKTFNDKAVALTGFMLPVKWSDGLVTDFMLLPNQMSCCFGMAPRINDVVIVHTAGQGVKAQKDVPISVLGTFHVGALRDNNYLVGIYRIDCERAVEPRVLNGP